MDLYYQDYLKRKTIEHGNKFDASALAPQFVPYFHSDVRIRVQDGDRIIAGTVGVTIGWRPAFILMSRSSAHGSSEVLYPEHKIIAVKRGRKYVPVTP